MQMQLCCNCVFNLNTMQEAKYLLAYYFSNNSISAKIKGTNEDRVKKRAVTKF
jgi:hypothetical protein